MMAATIPLTPPSPMRQDATTTTTTTATTSSASTAYQDDSLLPDSSSDNMATDWSQWMRWDDFDRLSPSTTSLGNPNCNTSRNGSQNPITTTSASAITTNQMPPTTTTTTTNAADMDIGLQLNDVDFKPSIDAFDDQGYDNANNNNNNNNNSNHNLLQQQQQMNGLLPAFNPVGAGVGVGVREFGSFSSDMVSPFAPAYSPQYANLKRHSIAVPAFPQNQMGQMQMLQQNLALRTNPNAAALGSNDGARPPHPNTSADPDSYPINPGPGNIPSSVAAQNMSHMTKSPLHPQNLQTASSTTPMPSRKRKSAADVSSLSSATATLDEATGLLRRPSSRGGSTKVLPSKKRSHNVIEKRYRANLNEKIAELRDAVPSLRIMARQRSRAGIAVPGSPHSNGDGAGQQQHDLDADDDVVGGSGSKLNKASILSKATEYIRHLESRNKRLDEENVELKNRLRQLEKTTAEQSFIGGGGGANGIGVAGAGAAGNGTNGVASTPHGSGSGTFSGRNSLTVNGNLHTTSSPDSYTMSTDSASGGSPMFSHAEHTDEFSPEGSPNPLYPPEGLIKVPDYLKSMRPTGPQAHYADDYRGSLPNSNVVSRHHSPDASASASVSASASGTGYSDVGGPSGPSGPGRFMLGTLAALMIVGIDESYRNPEDKNDRGLLGVPITQFRYGVQTMKGWIRASFGKGNGFTQSHMQALFGVLISSAAVFSCAIVVFLYLFHSGSGRRGRGKVPKVVVNAEDADAEANQVSASASTTAAASAQPWLAQIQSIWVSGHRSVPEWFAVLRRMLEYIVRCALGSSVYSSLTGITDEDENARVKAWDIALDTQLTGRDPEVSRSRLILTAFAAGTLPQSPARMMLKALQVRIILWRVGLEDSLISTVLNDAAIKIARYQWEEARKLHARLPFKHQDRLPRHLALLLQHPCEEVITDSIVQRSVNVVCNRPTQEATPGDDAMLDMVADDASISRPLDYLASWWSCGKLQETLLKSWESIEQVSSGGDGDEEEEEESGAIAEDEHMTASYEKSLNQALSIAPPASMASVMARVMKAIFVDEDRVANINAVLDILSKSPQSVSGRQQHQQQNKPQIAPSLVSVYDDLTSPVPSCIRIDLRLAIRSAMIIAILRRQVFQHAGQLIGIRGRVQLGGSACSGRDPRLTVAGAMKAFNNLPVDAVELGLAGCAALWWALRVVAREEEEAKKADSEAGGNTTGSSVSSGSSDGSTLRERSLMSESWGEGEGEGEGYGDGDGEEGKEDKKEQTNSTSPASPLQPRTTSRRSSTSSASSIESMVSLTRTMTSASGSDECVTPNPELAAAEFVQQRNQQRQQQQHEEDLHQQQLRHFENTIPSPDLRRIATHLAYWARHAYNPISYGFTPVLNEKVVSECYAICDLVERADKKGKMGRGRRLVQKEEEEVVVEVERGSGVTAE